MMTSSCSMKAITLIVPWHFGRICQREVANRRYQKKLGDLKLCNSLPFYQPESSLIFAYIIKTIRVEPQKNRLTRVIKTISPMKNFGPVIIPYIVSSGDHPIGIKNEMVAEIRF